MTDSWRQNGAGVRLSGAEAAELSRQIAGLAQAGLPLAHGLVALGEELPRGRLRRSMNDLAATLESGATLDQALQIQKNRIPPHLRGLVIAGLRSGRLGDVLSRFSEYTGVGTELKRRLWLNLAYPILTVCTAMALFFFVCVILVGQFDAIYRDFSIPLPRMTIALISIGAGGQHGLGPGGDRHRCSRMRLAGGRIFSDRRPCGAAWRDGCRLWVASGGRRRSPSSAICWPCSWKASCRCPKPSG